MWRTELSVADPGYGEKKSSLSAKHFDYMLHVLIEIIFLDQAKASHYVRLEILTVVNFKIVAFRIWGHVVW